MPNSQKAKYSMKAINVKESSEMLDEYLKDYKYLLGRLVDINDKFFEDEELRNMQSKFIVNTFDRCVKDILAISNELCQYQQFKITRCAFNFLTYQEMGAIISLTHKALPDLQISDKDCMKVLDNFKQLVYFNLTSEEYKYLYQKKLAQCAERQKSEQKKAMINACGLTNPIYQHIYTFDLEDDELYRYPFICSCSPKDFEQYFLFLSLEHEQEVNVVEKKHLGTALKDLLRSQNELIESSQTFQELMTCLRRCNSLFNKGWSENRLNDVMLKLFKSSAAVELDKELRDFKKARAAVAYIVGRLKKVGVYQQIPDRVLAEKLAFEKLKNESLSRYINQGHNTDVKRDYLDCIENIVGGR